MQPEASKQPLKSRLRSEIRRRRATLSPERRRSLDGAINEHLLGYLDREKPAALAAYLAFDGEPDLEPALRHARAQGTVVALPVVVDQPGRPVIMFRQWSVDGALTTNRYGIHEPIGSPPVALADLDLVLVPLVAWDVTGGRLGMGASYYDRLFQPYAAQPSPLRLGVAYQLQQVDEVPREPWDVRLHGVLTESGRFTCEG
jgi:5-formyltetrahydrofolate cyclo-ligase